MSSYFQAFLATRVPLSAASQTSERVRDWLSARDLIVPEPVGFDGHYFAYIYAPGGLVRNACDPTEALRYVPRDDHAVKIGTGYQFKIDASAATTMRCPRCEETCDISVAFAVLEQVYARRDPEDPICTHCGFSGGLMEWALDPPSSIAIGHVRVEFYEWPRLSRSFVRELEEVVGDGLVRVEGKI